MKKRCQGRAAFAAIAGILVVGCISRDEKETCSKSYAELSFSCGGPAGLSLLIAVDTSSSMADKQDLIATSVYNLVDTLTAQNPDNFDFVASPITNIHVAVVSSDLGLVTSEDHIVGAKNETLGCTNPDGDNGAFLTTSKGGESCLSTDSDFAEIDWNEPPNGSTNALATRAECMASQNAEGCEVEQMLESVLLALENRPDFIARGSAYGLAIVVFSDEDDFSISDPALFETTSWRDTPNIAGAYPEENGQYLFPMERYKDRLQAIVDYPVFFGAVIGVPDVDECRGEITDKGCLDHPEMQIVPDDASSGEMTGALAPACTKTDTGSGRDIRATPGRRYVELAEELLGYVISICNDDMDTMIKQMASRIWDAADNSCWSKPYRHEGYAFFDSSDCIRRVKFTVPLGASDDCPEALYDGWGDSLREQFLQSREVSVIKNFDGSFTDKSVSCILPELSLPKDCRQAAGAAEPYTDRAGWYYCENNFEGSKNTCLDGRDNDADGLLDCEDDGCRECDFCGGTKECLLSPACDAQQEVTPKTLAVLPVDSWVETLCRTYEASDTDIGCE